MTTSTKPHPRLSSRLGALSLLTIALVFGASAVPAASTTPQNAAKSQAKVAYVALGDSFTSGQGAPPYLEPMFPCLRSASASYPIILATRSPYELVANQSCSGASMGDVITQVTELPAGLKGPNSPVRLVTLTVGGIDASSNDVLAVCTTTPEFCEGAITDAATQLQLFSLAPNLAATYGAVASAMPNAKIVVFTYPLLFHPNAAGLFGTALVDGVNLTTTLLNANIELAAGLSNLGDRIQVVDVTQEFSNHGIGAKVPYISFEQPLSLATFHPNALGNSRGYFRALLNDRVMVNGRRLG